MAEFTINPFTGRKIRVGAGTHKKVMRLLGSGRRGFVAERRRDKQHNRLKNQRIPKPKQKKSKTLRFTRTQERRAMLSYELLLKNLHANMRTLPSLSTNLVDFYNKSRISAKNGKYIDAVLYMFMSFAILLTYTPTQLEQGFNSSRFNALKGTMGPFHTNPDVMLRWHQLKPKNKRKLNRKEIRALAKVDTYLKTEIMRHNRDSTYL